MTYEALRHFADSYGLAAMALLYLGLAGWALRPGSHRHHERASNMIFEKDRNDG